MSRTRKGSKAPGWEPWSNLRERQELAANQRLDEYRKSDEDREEWEDDINRALECYHFGPCEKCKATS